MSYPKTSLNVKSDAELLSYIINSDPTLSAELPLPKQGESIKEYGKLISENQRYRNAFINTINVLGLTMIHRNEWENPWDYFTNRGTLNRGDSVREMIIDLPEAKDYNKNFENKTAFLATESPDVYQFIHTINFQKYYQTTTSDEQMAMAFNGEEGSLITFIQDAIGMLDEGRKYDKYCLDKYQLCRRILDGSLTSIEIDGYSSLTTREIVAKMKGISNRMTFRKPNYNPAGLRLATKHEDQIVLLDADIAADVETTVLATSFFKDEAKFKTNMAMIDSWSDHDVARLVSIMGADFVPFTDGEITALQGVAGTIIDKEFFQDYTYTLDNATDPNSTRAAMFFNPTTLENNHYLHVWGVIATSPFKNGVVFTKDVTPAVSAVSVSPSTASVTVGQKLQLSASVTAAGFANKSVLYTIAKDGETRKGKMATINQYGELTIPAGHITGNGTQGTYVLTIGTALADSDTVVIDGVSYTPEAGDDTAAEQAAALATLFSDNAKYTVTQGTSGNANKLTFVEKSGYYGAGAPTIDDSDMLTGKITESTTTPGVPDGNIVVKATSIFNKSVSGTATITAVATA